MSAPLFAQTRTSEARKKLRLCLGRDGFTLTELIIVMVILAILLAVLVPSMIGWVQRAKETRLTIECRACVTAAQSLATQESGSGGALLSGTPPPDAQRIQALAQVEGRVTELILDSNQTVLRLTYERGTDSVTYDRGTYLFRANKTYINEAEGYRQQSVALLEDLKTGFQPWKDLRAAFQGACGGAYPSLGEKERQLLDHISAATLDTLTWKPTPISKDGNSIKNASDVSAIVMIASNSSSENNAYLLYWNGTYYTHDNGHGKQDSAFVTDQGTLDLSKLEQNGWVPVRG